ncbi:glycosyltransferase [Akkermansiaceae bacterium]|nr:glycosyltransferase [Akkermansiaceae bacterium]
MKKVNQDKQPLLSVCLITYNHVDYIRKAVEGVLMQNVSFSWEFIIADDCSSDGTREILFEYQKKFPELIKLIIQKKNVGAAKNWIELITYPQSKYIAYFEGDDFWTDSSKLQKQVDFLEQNNDYGLVHTNHDVLKNGKLIERVKRNKNIPTGNVIEQLLYKNFISSLTVCMRNSTLQNAILIVDFRKYLMGDLPLWMAFSQLSKIGYLDCSTGVYRHVENSASHCSSELEKFQLIKSAFELKFDFIAKYKYSEKIISSVNDRYAKYLFKFALVTDQPDIRDEFFRFIKNRRGLKMKGYSLLFKILTKSPAKNLLHYF